MRNRAVMMVATLALVAGACGGSSDVSESDVVVVVTTTILGDIVTNATGEGVRIEVLMSAGADPHDFQASSRQVALLQDADLVVANGFGLEEGLEDVLEALEEDGVPVLWASDVVEPLAAEDDHAHDEDAHDDDAHDDDAHDEDGHDDDAHDDDAHDDDAHDEEGHDHGDVDPHIWMDPVRMAAVARAVAVELDTIVPGGGHTVRAEQYATELEALADEMADILAGVDRRLLVTNHDALQYFADRFGFEVIGTVIPSSTTLAGSSSADLSALVQLLRETGVTAIFADNTDTTALADAVAAELGGQVTVVTLFTGSIDKSASGAGTYIEMMRTNARLVAEALG